MQRAGLPYASEGPPQARGSILSDEQGSASSSLPFASAAWLPSKPPHRSTLGRWSSVDRLAVGRRCATICRTPASPRTRQALPETFEVNPTTVYTGTVITYYKFQGAPPQVIGRSLGVISRRLQPVGGPPGRGSGQSSLGKACRHVFILAHRQERCGAAKFSSLMPGQLSLPFFALSLSLSLSS